MPGQVRTKSELLFEEVCDRHGIVWARLPECQDRPQPDYELSIDGQRIVAEIKQIEPNDEDRAYTEALRLQGRVSGVWNPDERARRVRDDVRASRRQLREYLEPNPGAPALLVIFDNTDCRYDDQHNILTAMHGWEQAVISTAGDRPVIVEQGFAPRNNSTIRHDVNRHLSALVTLHEFADFDTHERKLGLRFYHNEYADVPFTPELWQGPEIYHLRLGPKEPGQYQDWEPME